MKYQIVVLRKSDSSIEYIWVERWKLFENQIGKKILCKLEEKKKNDVIN